MRLEIQRPKKLKVFDSLRLPMENTAEAATEVLAIEVALELITELVQTELTRTELVQTKLVAQVEIQQLKAQVKIQQLKELKVLLITIHY